MLDDPTPRAVSVFVSRPGRRRHLEPPHPGLARSGRAAGPATRAEAPFYPAFEPTADQIEALGPTDLVTSVGARSGPIRQDAAATLSSLGLTSRTLAGAGHLAPVEAPDAFADLVRSIPRRREVQR